MLFEQETLHFHFAPAPASYVASPAPGFMNPDPEEDPLGRTTSAETRPGFSFRHEAVKFPV